MATYFKHKAYRKGPNIMDVTSPLFLKVTSPDNKWNSPNLLEEILLELSKDHIGDDNLKMTNFLVCVSGLSPEPSLRKSIANKGNSSTGKDNAVKASLKHMPDGSYIFLTSATQATIEDDIKDKRIIALSEVNASRELGANKFLIEVIKQKTEGGTSAIKKDIRKGMKEARHEQGDQASILYNTTETSSDEELGTRFIEGNIKTSYDRIKKVNENTMDYFSDMDKLIQTNNKISSWIKIGLTSFFKKKIQYKILLPYAKFLKDQIKGQDIFDYNHPRSQRDIKRLLALTCATTYLFQLQRKVKEYGGHHFLISEPIDLINTLTYTQEFFNQSYTGLDARLSRVLEIIDKEKKEWVARDDIQTELNVSRNTIKSYCQILADEGCLKGVKGSELNFESPIKMYDSNKIYYQRCQKGINRPLIRCQLSDLKEYLEQKTKEELTPFDADDNNLIIDDKKVSENRVSIQPNKVSNDQNSQKIDENKVNNPQIDTLKLTPSKNKPNNLDIKPIKVMEV